MFKLHRIIMWNLLQEHVEYGELKETVMYALSMSIIRV